MRARGAPGRTDVRAPSRPKDVRKSVKTTTDWLQGTQTRENSNLMLPAGNDGPAGSKPFRGELWILPGEEGGIFCKISQILLIFQMNFVVFFHRACD